MSDIELLEKQVQNNPDISEAVLNEINEKKEALENIFRHEAEGAFVRSRVQYKLDGEKPTKMFCALEKHNGMQRYVPQLFVENNDGTEKLVNEQSKVEKEIHKYYEGLFSNKDFVNCDSIDTFLGENCNDIPKLSEIEKVNMEGKITLNEMTNYLKKC